VITTARRRLSGLLGWLAFHVNPDPPLEFSLKSRIDIEYPDLADLVTHMINGSIGGDVGRS